MDMTSLLVFIVLSPLCVLSQVTLQVSGPGTVKPSEQLRMTCTVSGFELTNYHIQWFREPLGKGIEWIGGIWADSSTAFADTMKNRVAITKDNKRKEIHFQMNGMEAKDMGTYYCSRYGQAKLGLGFYFDYWSSGSLVTVTSVTYLKPVVYPMIAGNQGTSEVTFGCLVRKYFPVPMTIAVRTTGGATPPGLTIFPAVKEDNPSVSYTRGGQITVSKTAWIQNTYQCQITHNSTNIQKTIPKGCISLNPRVKLSQGSCPGENNSKQVQLVFHVSGFSSQEIEVKWFVNDKETPLASEVTPQGTFNGGYSILGNVNISQAEWNSGASYKCKVKDKKTGKEAEDVIRKCSDNINCLGINLFIIGPTAEDLIIHDTPSLKCLASNIPKSSGYQFHWSQEGGGSLQFTVEDPKLSKNGSFSVTSILFITNAAWYSGKKFTCTFTYPGLPSPLTRMIFKDLESKTYGPSVAVYPPSSEELSKKENVTLGCLANHFYPENIYMGWLRNGEEIPKDFYSITDPKAEAQKKSFFVNRELEIPEDVTKFYYIFGTITMDVANWTDDSKYTCVVGHEGLPLNLIQKTIDRNTGNPKAVTVNVQMCDTAVTCS